ncbi:DeoR/GlpR family DNA-binding transcription regulator [Bacillus sp. JJ1127]|uniref:DeoR/GlpR family DNA-binding transcription regulator n=1 Tax=Bacillus sp. JJ1127 TaxID=3122952 RepID=UPI0030001E68
MFTEERRGKILELLKKEGRVIAKDLAEMFEMSIDSIRRDLSIMEEKGLLKRTHGGAIESSKVRTLPAPLSKRYGEGSKYDNAIAKAAASFIQKGDSVFIGGASIHYTMLKYLPNTHFTVVTNSMKIADTLKENEFIDTYLVGGKVKSSGNITDSLAYEFIQQFSIDLYFSTGGGVSINGISTATPEVASFGKAVSEISRRNICLAPHYKLGVEYFVKGESLREIDLLITDEEANEETIQQIENKGMKVLVAKSSEEKE